MIHDAYTREYDERARHNAITNKLNKVVQVAKRFGCYTRIVMRKDDFTLHILLPDGKKFKEFRKLQTALDWANKWE